MSPEAERLLSCLTLVLTAMVPQDLCLALAGGVTNTVPGLEMTVKEERRTMGVALSKLQPEQVWTWQALAAGTPAEATLQGLLPALASLFQVQGLVTPRAPGWRHQRLTLAMGEWHKSLPLKQSTVWLLSPAPPQHCIGQGTPHAMWPKEQAIPA
ncbi:hypothetical protein V8C86DRAFT_2477095 [Haematococcus lacustris]